MLKKIISIFMCFVFFVQVPVFADSNKKQTINTKFGQYGMEVLQDDADIKKVRVSNNSSVAVCVLDKNLNTVTVKEDNKNVITLNLSEPQTNNMTQEVGDYVVREKITSCYWGFSGAASHWTYDNTVHWSLNCDNGCGIFRENGDNISRLESFYSEVSEINKCQVQANMTIGTAIASTIAGAISLGSGLTALLALVATLTAIAEGASAVYQLWDAKQHANEANYQYSRL